MTIPPALTGHSLSPSSRLRHAPLKEPTPPPLRTAPHQQSHLTIVFKLQHRCNHGCLCGRIYKEVFLLTKKAPRFVTCNQPVHLPTANFPRIAIMHSQGLPPTTPLLGVALLGVKRRTLLSSWMTLQKCAPLTGLSIIPIELMRLRYRQVRVLTWLHSFIDF
jgi:hypothetical protein